MAKSEPIKLHPKVRAALERQAADLGTTVNWIVEAALVEQLRDLLPPGFTAGIPHRERDE